VYIGMNERVGDKAYHLGRGNKAGHVCDNIARTIGWAGSGSLDPPDFQVILTKTYYSQIKPFQNTVNVYMNT